MATATCSPRAEVTTEGRQLTPRGGEPPTVSWPDRGSRVRHFGRGASYPLHMAVPDPKVLLGRKKYGREEYVQDMLAALIVGGDPPRWNVPSIPTERGGALLTAIARPATTDWEPPGGGLPTFVNEFELRRRHEDEVSGWPDFAAIWPSAVFVIELKT